MLFFDILGLVVVAVIYLVAIYHIVGWWFGWLGDSSQCTAEINLNDSDAFFGEPKRTFWNRYDVMRCDRENTPEAHLDGFHQAPYLSATSPGCSWSVVEGESAYSPRQGSR